MPEYVVGEVVIGAVDVEEGVRAIGRLRAGGVKNVEEALQSLVRHCASAPAGTPAPTEGLLRLYEAAVRVSFSPKLAGDALDLVFKSPDFFGADERVYSRALLFATAANRLSELQDRLRGLRTGLADPQIEFNCELACAGIALIENDLEGLRHHAGQAASLLSSPERERAYRLGRESYWLDEPGLAPRISQWRLRGFHQLLPREVAEWLEDSDLVSPLDDDDAISAPAVRRVLAEASGMLEDAARLVEDPYGRQPRLREALGAWALRVGCALIETGHAWEAVPFTCASWRLLELALPDSVVEAHARAVGIACAGLDRSGAQTMAERVVEAMPASEGQARLLVPQVLAAWSEGRRDDGLAREAAADLADRLRPVSRDRPQPTLEAAIQAAAYRLAGCPSEVRDAIGRCLADRALLLPDEAPFRGRRWFECPNAHEAYLAGREEADSIASYKHLEEAWLAEPDNTVTIQGLIQGLRRRLQEKPGREHLLRRFAKLLDQMDHREVEAALAYTSLAELADRANHQMERRRWLRSAVRVLHRRVSLRPWTRARHAEIALQLELGDLAAAGTAAWEEASLHLPGTPESRDYALLAATLWERASGDQQVDHDLVDEAHQLTKSPALSMLEAVQFAASRGHLVLLTDLDLDEAALEELWMECRGNEDELRRFLVKQGTRRVDPRSHYVDFLRRKHEPAESGAPTEHEGDVGCPVSRLRQVTWEVLSLDPLRLASPTVALAEPRMSEFNATLKECAHLDEGAVEAFIGDVAEALNALFVLREAAQSADPELLVSCLGRASRSVGLVKRSAERFRDTGVAAVARLLWRHLALALEPPMRDLYQGEKAKRLVPSHLGVRLYEWWNSLSSETGQLDLFHLHLVYRCPKGVDTMRWWQSSEAFGRPARDAVRDLARSLERHARGLDAIDAHFQQKRDRRPGPKAFGLRDEFDECLRVLHAALGPDAGPDEVRAVEGALERLGTTLRRIDMSRLIDLPDLVYDPALRSDSYLLPRVDHLLTHLRRNARGEPFLQVVLDVQDATGQDVLCVLSVDAGRRPVPASVQLRGLAPFADLIEALGGQFHLWVARSDEPSGCRCEHDDGGECEANEYVQRIEARLDLLVQDRPALRTKIEPWLKTLGGALHANGNAAVAFALVPQVRE